MTSPRIVIIGAGIGGLTTALSLHGAGYDVEVYESARDIKPLGVGINLLPHAVRVLTQLGLQERMSRVAVETSELVYHNRFGQRIWQEPRGRFAGYQWPQFSIHRGVFQLLLLDHVRRVLGSDRIHTGMMLDHLDVKGDHALLFLHDRHTDQPLPPIKADAVIGADGIHSVVRKHFFPNEGMPKFSGIMLHRGTTYAQPFLSGSSMIMAGSAKQKFVAYPISPADRDTGLQVINWVADLQVGHDGHIPPRDWNRRADKPKLLDAFRTWTFDWLDAQALIQGAEYIYEFPMSDRDPLPWWSHGPVTLLGDAAHPMYPIGSNGASQAILDAECLTRCLSDHKDPSVAFQAYESIRLPATSAVVLKNREMGPEQVMQIAEDRAPNGFAHIHDVIPPDELQAIANRYKEIAGFDRATLNQKS
jgi:5-methylphenazine-1-carboxylate 1-monooxygenase